MDQRHSTELSRDQIFDILSNVRRRYVLFHLSRSGGELSLQDLSRELAAWENDVPREEVSRKQQKRVYVSLYQTHVPKLEEAGIVEYDEDGTVRLTGRATEVTAYLEEGGSDRRWSLYFLVLSLVGTLSMLLVGLDVGPFDAVPDLVAGVAVVGAFALLSIAYFLARERGPGGLLDEAMDGI